MKRVLVILIVLCMVLFTSVVSVFAVEQELRQDVSWEQETKIPTPGETTVTSVGNKIYVIGSSGNVQIYDAKEKEWSVGSVMPTKRLYMSSCAVGNKIYVIGGAQNNTAIATMNIYDTETDTWKIGKPMSTKRWNPLIVSHESKIYVMGGQDGATTYASVEVYDIEKEQWVSGVEMPNRLAAGGSVAVADNLYTIGGGAYNRSWDMTNMVQRFDITTGTWSIETPMPSQVGIVAATLIGDRIYVLGDSTPYAILSKKVGIYNLSTKEWEEGPSLIANKCTNNSMYIDGKLYIAGGYKAVSPNIPSDTIETIQIIPPTVDILSVLLNMEEQVQLSVAYDLERNAEMVWTSTNEAVATVTPSGKVTAIGEGLAYINVKDSEGIFDESIPIRVFKENADTFRLAVSLNTNEKVRLYLSEEEVTWTSLDESIATVTDVGEVTAINNGLVIIEARLEGKVHQIYVRVKNSIL